MITVELYGGPRDGAILTLDPSQPMPVPLPDHPGYTIAGPVPDVWPGRWRYGWQAPRTGRRQPCGRPDCAGGCPNRKQVE